MSMSKNYQNFLLVKETDARCNGDSWIISFECTSTSPGKSKGKLDSHIWMNKRTNLIRSLSCIRSSPCTEGVFFRKSIELNTFDVDGIRKYVYPFIPTPGCEIAVPTPKVRSSTDPIQVTDPSIHISIECSIAREQKCSTVVKSEVKSAKFENLDISNTTTSSIGPAEDTDCSAWSVWIISDNPPEVCPRSCLFIDEIELREGS